MLLHRKSVELLAPAGTWDAMTAGIEAGADAVYLGGKHFNMRLHEGDFNFDDKRLKEAVDYAHAHGVHLYITLNNLISNEELPALRDYLSYLSEIRPDAILVQDFAVLELVHEMGITIPLHTSVMMNTHNEHAIEKLKEYGITRIVVGREMTLSELALFRVRTGIEVEYFMHGDMCISESGQCIHSGVLFGQSGNRGRCMKICRWPFTLINEETGAVLDADSPGPYKLALKDMCMYRSIPELIQAGVHSFKIEGRMRSPTFIARLVSTYRKAIDAYIADPNGYATDEEGWRTLYENRVRDYTTTFAFGQPTAIDIGMTGEREPRFFSQAIEEAGFADDVLRAEPPIEKGNTPCRHLSVRVGTTEAARIRFTSAARHSAPTARGNSATTRKSSAVPQGVRVLWSIRRAQPCAENAASWSSSLPHLTRCPLMASWSAILAHSSSPKHTRNSPSKQIIPSTYSTTSLHPSSKRMG